MATAQSAFEKRERAAEEEERLSMLKRLEKLVAQGRLDASVLDEVKKATSPDVHHATGKQPSSWRQGIVVGVEVSPGVFKDVPGEVAARTEYVYAHTPGKAPLPKPSETERMKTGIHVDMGPSRWNPDGGESIFSLTERLAEGPAKVQALPPHEAARLARIQAAAGGVQVPTLFGYKLEPHASRRTFFLGSLLAIGGTAALVAASARGLGPGAGGPAEEAGGRAAGTYSPMGERLAGIFLPWRTRVAGHRASRAEVEAEHGEFVRRLKQRMVEGRA